MPQLARASPLTVLVGEEQDLAGHGLVTQHVLGMVGEVLEPLQGREDLDRVGLWGRLPLLARDELAQRGRVFEDRVAQTQQVAAALLEG